MEQSIYDTGFLFAVLDEDDKYHSACLEIYHELAQDYDYNPLWDLVVDVVRSTATALSSGCFFGR